MDSKRTTGRRASGRVDSVANDGLDSHGQPTVFPVVCWIHPWRVFIAGLHERKHFARAPFFTVPKYSGVYGVHETY